MADPDDLLDGDGDLNDISYDLDCAEEDALLADDNDYTYKTSLVTRHVTFSDNGDLDEDAIELGVEDDLQVPDDAAEEVGLDSSYSVVESSIPTTYNNLVGGEDSDEDEDKRKKERSRFTNERNIGVPTCIKTTPTSIPDTLDKVEVKKAGISTATLKCRMRTRGGGIRPVRPINIHINPHFRAPPHHHPHPHHHQPGPPRWENNYGHPSGYQPPQPYPNQFGPPRPRAPPAQAWNFAPQGYSPEPPLYQPPYQDSFYGGGGHHGPPHHGGPPHHHGRDPPHHGGPPHHAPHPGGPMFQPHGPNHDPNFHPDHGYHPPQHQGKWNRDHPAPPQHFPPPSPQGGLHHGYGGVHPSPQHFPPRGPPRPPHPQFQQPRPPQPRPPHVPPIQQGSNLRARLGPPVKREHPDGVVTKKAVKVARIDGSPVQNLVVSVRSNLQTVNTVQSASGQPPMAPVKPLNVRPHLSGRPTPVVPATGGVLHREVRGMSIPITQLRHGQLPRPRNPMIRPQHPLQAQRLRHPVQPQRPRHPVQPQRPRHPVQPQRPQNPVVTPRPPPKTLFPGAKEEELNAYMKKIEEQKQKRAMILKEKEQKRASSVTCSTPTVVRTVSLTAPDKNEPKQLGNEPEMKVVRVKTKDGRIVLRKLPLDRISKMKKLGPNGEPIVEKTVLVNNLSASTTKQQILVMARKVGAIASIELNQDAKEAKVKFVEAKAAQDFISKFQRKMVDLSMINLTLIAD